MTGPDLERQKPLKISKKRGQKVGVLERDGNYLIFSRFLRQIR